MHVLHINILISEYFLVQGSRSCDTEQNGISLPQNGGRNLPARTLEQEVWAAWEAVSRPEPALPKALPAPQLTGLHTLGAPPGTSSYTHGTLESTDTSAAGQALCSQLSVFLLGAHSLQGHSCHRNLPAMAMDQNRTELSHNQQQHCFQSVCCTQPPVQHQAQHTGAPQTPHPHPPSS